MKTDTTMRSVMDITDMDQLQAAGVNYALEAIARALSELAAEGRVPTPEACLLGAQVAVRICATQFDISPTQLLTKAESIFNELKAAGELNFMLSKAGQQNEA